MAIRKLKPTSNGHRNMSVSTFEEVTTAKPYKALTTDLKSKAGRNNTGRTTVRFRGGGVKRRYRIIDFKRDKDNIPAKVQTIEYDPNRSAYIALVAYADGEKRYILLELGYIFFLHQHKLLVLYMHFYLDRIRLFVLLLECYLYLS